MNKIGFFGGCFNPPTKIHINIANKLIEQGKLDKVVFVPVNDYYKKSNLVEAKHRYNLLKIITKDFKNLEVDDLELKENRELYAVDAFKLIENKYSKSNLFFIMGSDNYKKMSTWKDYNKIKDKYNYIVIDRDENEISSTQIRNMIVHDDKKMMEYLPKEVYDYIVKNKLYKSIRRSING